MYVLYVYVYRYVRTVQLNLNFTHVCRHTRVQAHACACTFNECKTSKTGVVHALLHAILVCACRPVNTSDTREMHIMRLALGLLHYTCGVTTGTVAVGNELQLFATDRLLYLL